MKKVLCFFVFCLLSLAVCAGEAASKYFGQYVSYTTPQGAAKKALGKSLNSKTMKLYFIPTNAVENTCLRKTMIVLNTKKGKVPTGFFMTHQSMNYMRKSRGSGSLFQQKSYICRSPLKLQYNR